MTTHNEIKKIDIKKLMVGDTLFVKCTVTRPIDEDGDLPVSVGAHRTHLFGTLEYEGYVLPRALKVGDKVRSKTTPRSGTVKLIEDNGQLAVMGTSGLFVTHETNVIRI